VFKRRPLSTPRRDSTNEGNWRRVGQNEEKGLLGEEGTAKRVRGGRVGARSTPSFRVRQREGLQAARSKLDRYFFLTKQQRDLPRKGSSEDPPNDGAERSPDGECDDDYNR
jgi:hypothetical protein